MKARMLAWFGALILLALALDWIGECAWAADTGWMQKGVRVWYFGSAGSYPSSSNAVEAYLLGSVNGHDVQLIKHSALDYWSSPQPIETSTYSLIDQGPFWIHPQILQTIAVGDNWMGINITSMNRVPYTYDTFIKNPEFTSIPYLLLPIKALFDLRNQREIVKLVYGIPYWPGNDVWGTAYFDSETGLCLFNEKVTISNLVWFVVSEINYDFANHRAFAEDNGPHTGFKSTITKTNNSTLNTILIQSMVETRYGDIVQMWVSTFAGGSRTSVTPPNENYCFFGGEPVLRYKYMTDTPNYPPEGWNRYGEYLWWWVPTAALQKSTINVFDVPMTRTSTAPYTFEAIGVGTGLYFPKIIFDNDGYMTDFTVKYTAIGLNIGLGSSALSASPPVPIHLVNGLEYYRNTMGRATPEPPPRVPRSNIPTIVGPLLLD